MAKKYKFTEINSFGKREKGVMEAKDKEEVKDYIMSRGNTPITIELVEEKKKIDFNIELRLGKKIDLADLAIFTKQMATMLKAGMTLIRALNVISEQSTNEYLKKNTKEVANDLQKGNDFSSSLKKEKNLYPKLMLSMIEAGELTGNIDEIFESLSTHYAKESKINKKISGALMYPAVLLVITIIVINVMFIFLVPVFMSILGDMELPLSTRILIGMSDFTKKYWLLILILLIGTITLVKAYIQSDRGKYNFDRVISGFPVISKPVITIATSRFTRTLSTLLKSGVSITDGLTSSANVTNNQILIHGMKNTVSEIKKGRSLSISLKELNFFPAMVISMINIGEESGDLEGMLSKTADFYDEELEGALYKLVSLLEPVLIVFMGLVVSFIMISIFLPLYGMYGNTL